MTQFIFPDGVKMMLRTLNDAGFDAYAVGGCTRDMLLGRKPGDWDITTSAMPDEVAALFETVIPTGLRHGTVTVKGSGVSAEVTTFRTEGAYTDRRHPDSVDFVRDVHGDLARRDFTMNAIAVPLSGEIIDPFGGRDDIARRTIRCVGEPERRFSEDALRMLRALRFSSQLEFGIEKKTLEGIYACAPLAAELSPERVLSEVRRLLEGSCADALPLLLTTGVMDAWCKRTRSPALSRVVMLAPQGLSRLTAVCAVLESEGCCRTEGFLKALRASSHDTAVCSRGAAAALGGLPRSEAGWGRLLRDIGEESCRLAAAAHLALTGDSILPALEAVLASGRCHSLKTLAVNGRNMQELGFSGCAVGQALDALLEHVIEFPEDNSRERLLQLAMRLKNKI